MTLQDRIWRHTFNRLLEGIHFNKLSVQDICELVQIHRSSFYRAFDDKFALIEYGITVLWNDYYRGLSYEQLKQPFASAHKFFAHSEAELLLRSQHGDLQLLNDVKRITLELLKVAYDGILVDDNDSLLSGYFCASIDYLDTWNQHQKEPLSAKELDGLFESIVLAPQVKNFIK